METNQYDSEKWGGEVEVDQSSETNKGKVIFLFVIGFLLGVSIKAQAVKTITMGYDDYKVRAWEDDFKAAEQKPAPDSSAGAESATPDQAQPAAAAEDESVDVK